MNKEIIYIVKEEWDKEELEWWSEKINRVVRVCLRLISNLSNKSYSLNYVIY